MYKAVVFDFDYTLGDSTNGIVMSVNHALDKLGYPEKSVEEIKPTIGLSLKNTFAFLTGKDSGDEPGLFAQYFKEKADLVMTDNTELYDGVTENISALKSRGYKIGVVTTKYHYRIEQILVRYDLVKWIDFIAGSDDVKIEKPDPEGLLLAAGHFGLGRENILYVGDSLVDAQTAQNASVAFAGVLTGTTKREDFEQYPFIYLGNDVKEVCQKILRKEI